jgi:hypothetical protein
MESMILEKSLHLFCNLEISNIILLSRLTASSTLLNVPLLPSEVGNKTNGEQ